MDNFQSGALIDTRPPEAKLKDYHFAEIVTAANPVTWVEKTQDQWRKFPIFNQDGSGSCVAQTLAKLAGILYWLKNGNYVHFSATHIYQRRSNKPGTGMIADDAWKLAREGITLEDLVPSQNMSDAQMDAVVIPKYKDDVGKIFAIPKMVQLPAGDIETAASVIQTTLKGLMLWTFWQNAEWTDHPKIIFPGLKLGEAQGVHSTAGVDFALVGGRKSIIIDDSWGSSFGAAGQRVLDEDFFSKRNWYLAYALNFVFDDQSQTDTAKPHHAFLNPLVFIEWDTVANKPKDPALNDAQKAHVIALQDILKYEGFFPKNVESTGYYGAITADGVLKWQIKHNVAPLSELNELAGRRVGNRTVLALNQIYGF